VKRKSTAARFVGAVLKKRCSFFPLLLLPRREVRARLDVVEYALRFSASAISSVFSPSSPPLARALGATVIRVKSRATASFPLFFFSSLLPSRARRIPGRKLNNIGKKRIKQVLRGLYQLLLFFLFPFKRKNPCAKKEDAAPFPLLLLSTGGRPAPEVEIRLLGPGAFSVFFFFFFLLAAAERSRGEALLFFFFFFSLPGWRSERKISRRAESASNSSPFLLSLLLLSSFLFTGHLTE